MDSYFPVDDMAEGATVRLLCSMTNPDRDRTGWADRTPVDVTRLPGALRFDWAGGSETIEAPALPRAENPLHRTVQEFAKRRGASWFFQFVPESVLVRQAYAARRREEATRARRSKYGRDTAAECLALARADVKAGRKLYNGRQIWAGLGGSDGKTHSAYGESRLRWFENPESKGFRFVGLVADLDRNRGAWYLDEYGGETVAGVVYQLPTRRGRLQFAVGYADPHNSDKRGRGPACLSLDLESVEIDSGWRTITERDWRTGARVSRRVYVTRQEAVEDAEAEAKRGAVDRADRIAERYAEAEREYQEAYREGRAAREKSAEAVTAARDWKDAMRAVRGMFRARHRAGLLGMTPDTMRDTLAGLVRAARAACDDLQEARDAAREARDSAPSGRWRRAGEYDPAAEGWRNGYADGL